MSNRKNKAGNVPPNSSSNRLDARRELGSKAAARAKTALRPTVQAAITATKLLAPEFPESDLNELINSLLGHVTAASEGNLARPEATLVSQAQTLDLLFNKLTRQAVQNIGHYPDTVALYMKLALRAQSQCRAVAETLHEMKHPRAVAFFQQANIANGPQQVNNGRSPPHVPSRTGENQKSPNELLEDTICGKQLDDGAAQSAAGSDIQMATLGEIDGPKTPGGGGKERVARNAYKGRQRDALREVSRALRAQRPE